MTASTPQLVAPGALKVGSGCPSCAGAGWKYVLLRSELRALGHGSQRVRSLARRSCLDCAGTGRCAA